MGTHGGRYALSELQIVDSDAFENIKRVGDLYAEGTTSPFTIARRLHMTVVEVRGYIETWHEIIRSDAESKDLARDALHTMLERYDRLIARAHENLKDLGDLDYDEKVSAQINATMKNVADWDAKRVDLLQKAGLLDAGELGDELAEREARETILINILRNDLCDDCKVTVRDKIAVLTGQVEGTIEGEVVE